jgi:hypothetical protein
MTRLLDALEHESLMHYRSKVGMLLRCAAREIRTLRGKLRRKSSRQDQSLSLTDEHREAIAYGVLLCEATAGCANDRATIDGASRAADVLRGLLERKE